MTKIIAITMGDPLGIGPEIICKALLSYRAPRPCRYIIVGNRFVFEKFSLFKKLRSLPHISFLDTSTHRHVDTSTQQRAGLASLLALKTATSLIRDHRADAMVTAPICKEHVHLAGLKFPGHTEFLCHEFKVKKFAMMFCAPQFRVVLSTIHVPHRDVPKLLTTDLVFDKLMLTAQALQSLFKIKHPRIAVCGLNPHAGENGLFGDEEARVILPAMKKFAHTKLGRTTTLVGPLPVDSVFVDVSQNKFDAILCHTHDQALIPLKLLARDKAVNMTLGLPFVRTSPAHGTAFDIAGKNKANPQSMIEAIKLATRLT